MASYPGVPISVIASGGTPIVIIGDPVWTGPFAIELSVTGGVDQTAWWNTMARSSDIGDITLALIAHMHSPTPVTHGINFAGVNNTQVANPLVPDPTAVASPGGPVVKCFYDNELLGANWTTLNNDLQASVPTLRAAGMQNIIWIPTGTAIANNTADPNFGVALNTVDATMFQLQRQGQWSASGLNSTTTLAATADPTINAIRAATSKPLYLQLTVYNPQSTAQFIEYSAAIQMINFIGARYHPAGISVYAIASANTPASISLQQTIIQNYRP